MAPLTWPSSPITPRPETTSLLSCCLLRPLVRATQLLASGRLLRDAGVVDDFRNISNLACLFCFFSSVSLWSLRLPRLLLLQLNASSLHRSLSMIRSLILPLLTASIVAGSKAAPLIVDGSTKIQHASLTVTSAATVTVANPVGVEFTLPALPEQPQSPTVQDFSPPDLNLEQTNVVVACPGCGTDGADLFPVRFTINGMKNPVSNMYLRRPFLSVSWRLRPRTAAQLLQSTAQSLV